MKYSILLQKYVPARRGGNGKLVTKRVEVEAVDIVAACEKAKKQYDYPDVSMTWPILKQKSDQLMQDFSSTYSKLAS